MKNDIKEKLQIILRKESLEESDIVYILSRVRKILEIDGKEKNFRKLKFYCDWSLHAQICNTDSMKDELDDFPNNQVNLFHFINYGSFQDEFKRFLKEYQLDTNIYDNDVAALHFIQILSQILSDTPLIVKTVKKKKIILTVEGDFLGLKVTEE